jgi:DUF4097 and DUF4098 domain-containing protein YvlB
MKRFTSLLAFCACFLSAAWAQDNDYSFKENYAASVPFQMEVSSFDGNIDLIAAEGNKVEVFYIVKRNNTTLKVSRAELEKDFILEVTSTSNSLTIHIKNKNELNFHVNNRIYVNFRIAVPKETSCRLHTSDGNVYVKGTRGSVDIKTSDGNIQLDNITGNVESSTSDGNIELTSVDGTISVRSSDGDISFKNVSGSFKAITSDGNIRGNLIELRKELTAKTGDGNIDVTVPDHLGLDLNIKGESLKVPLTNFTGRSDDNAIQGKLNGGGIAVTLTTSDGHIKLIYL